MTIEHITEFTPSDRYVYDFVLCTYDKGWAQIDTRQDASYYGTWTNPSVEKSSHTAKATQPSCVAQPTTTTSKRCAT
jgi:hypothetical protein